MCKGERQMKKGNLCDVAGLLVGHAQDEAARTGCTVRRCSISEMECSSVWRRSITHRRLIVHSRSPSVTTPQYLPLLSITGSAA